MILEHTEGKITRSQVLQKPKIGHVSPVVLVLDATLRIQELLEPRDEAQLLLRRVFRQLRHIPGLQLFVVPNQPMPAQGMSSTCPPPVRTCFAVSPWAVR